MLVQFSTKIKAVKRLHTQTPSRRQSHTVAQEAHECWVDQFGTLFTYITKLEVEILNDIYFFLFTSGPQWKNWLGVSMDAEQPLDGALDPQEKQKGILNGCSGNTSSLNLFWSPLCNFRAGACLYWYPSYSCYSVLGESRVVCMVSF